MYKPFIEINQYIDSITTKINEATENQVFEAIHKIGVNVDKEELIKALQYDRNQYAKGYEDGIKEGAIRFAKRLCEYYDIDFERSSLIQYILSEIGCNDETM